MGTTMVTPAYTSRKPHGALVLALLACSLSAPVQAQGETRDEPPTPGGVFTDLGWRLVPLSQMLEQAQRHRVGSRGMPRLLPLAMMPMPHSALWLGLSSPRGERPGQSEVQVELRWSIPLDRIGGAIEVRSLALR
jgi:hypothetical protein